MLRPGFCLLWLGIIATDVLAGPATRPAADTSLTRPIRVMVYADAGASARGPNDVAACLEKSPGVFEVKRVTAADIRAGALADADVLVQGGGSGSKQAESLAPEGREKIRTFVESGGGYIGICAGAYLATTDYTWSLGILNAKVLDRKHWNRGSGEVELAITPDGRSRFAIGQAVVHCQYYQGPLLAPGEKPGLPAYTPLVTYASEIARNGAPEGVMKGTTAAALATFGKGRVLVISPHPERSEGLDGLIRRSITWAAGPIHEDRPVAPAATQTSQ